MFKVWQWIDKNTHIAEDVMEKKGELGCNAELRVLLQAVLEVSTHYMQYPVSQLHSSRYFFWCSYHRI